MASGAIGSSRAKNGEPQPAPVNTQNDPAPSKRDLASWWRTFKKGSAKREEEKPAAPVGIFGVPLQTSIRYANVAISLYDDDGKSYIYGYVPIVVAKCGVFLKEKATDVEGIFRLAGSEKRIKELKVAFDSPERYGKGLDWTGYTVHDAANILRRYINNLPEPIIPLDFYEKFRAPLAPHQKKIEGSADSRVVLPSEFDYPGAIRTFKHLITELPPLNRQLLLYILDLLAVFASKSDVNKMTTTNLSSIFQPGVLSHPKNDMNPEAYFLSQDVLVFLIENQDNFLIGMQGTAADEKTVAEVQSGPPTPKLTKAQGGVARSASNSSAGAENLRKYGGVRRNASASSKRSKGSVAAASPVSPSFSGGGGVHRSNTVPSKRSPAVGPTRFSKDKVSDPPTPNSTNTPLAQTAAYPETKHLQPPAVISPSSNESTPKPSPMVETVKQKPAKEQLVIRDMPNQTLTPEFANQAHQPVTPPAGSSSTSKTFAAVFGAKSPPADNRKPNKLQKRRGPNSANPSAHSSTHSLSGIIQDQPPSPLPQHTSFPTDASADATPQKDANAALKPGLSPSGSLRSHPSTAGDLSGHENNEQSTEQADKEKKHRFRLSASRIDQPPPPNASGSTLGGPVTEQSTGRRSFTADQSVSSTVTTTITSNTVTSDDDKRESEKRERGPLGWVKGKLQEHKNREAEKHRAKSPPEGKQEVVSPEAKPQAEAPPAAKAQDSSPPKAEAAPAPAPPAES